MPLSDGELSLQHVRSSRGPKVYRDDEMRRGPCLGERDTAEGAQRSPRKQTAQCWMTCSSVGVSQAPGLSPHAIWPLTLQRSAALASSRESRAVTSSQNLSNLLMIKCRDGEHQDWKDACSFVES